MTDISWGNLFGGVPAPEKGARIHGHKTGDHYYVRAEDIADLLDANGVLPGIAKKLRNA